MFHYNRICLVVVFFSLLDVILTLKVSTEKSVTAVLGGNISLPCNISRDKDPYAVFWYKHNFTRSIDNHGNEGKLVAREYRGSANPVPGIERFRITKDYSLVINNVSILDETTYSCKVGLQEEDGILLDETGHTDLRVIALGELMIEPSGSCAVTEPGRCIIAKDPPDQVKIFCKLVNVRPPANLTWTRSDGTLVLNTVDRISEKDGLYTISSQLLISKPHFDEEFICHAEGEAINGISSMAVTRDVETVLVSLVVMLYECYRGGLFRISRAGGAIYRKSGKAKHVESQALNDQQGERERNNTTLSQQIEDKKNERDEDKARLGQNINSMELVWGEKLTKTQSTEQLERENQELKTQNQPEEGEANLQVLPVLPTGKENVAEIYHNMESSVSWMNSGWGAELEKGERNDTTLSQRNEDKINKSFAAFLQSTDSGWGEELTKTQSDEEFKLEIQELKTQKQPKGETNLRQRTEELTKRFQEVQSLFELKLENRKLANKNLQVLPVLPTEKENVAELCHNMESFISRMNSGWRAELDSPSSPSEASSSSTSRKLGFVIPFQAKAMTPSDSGHFFFNTSKEIQDRISICLIGMELRTSYDDTESLIDNQQFNNPGMQEIWRNPDREMALSNALHRTIDSFFQTIQFSEEALSMPADVQTISLFVKEDAGVDADKDDLPGEDEISPEKARLN